MSSELLISVDTETGGFNCKSNALLTLGVYVVETETEKIFFRKEYKFNNYVEVVDKTPNDSSGAIYVEKKALEINKINLQELAESGVSTEDVDTELNNFFKEISTNKNYRLIPIGQNLKFDLGFISVNLPLFYSFLMSCRYHRELSTASSMWHLLKSKDYNKSVSLDNMRKEFNIISSGQTHSSLVDAEDTFIIYKRIMSDMKL